jgi:membrane fusion protein YbhG
MRRFVVIVLILLAIVVAIGGALYANGIRPRQIVAALMGPPPNPNIILLSGNIEAHESILSFTRVQGAIVSLAFDSGAHVRAGMELARMDNRIYRRQAEIDQANLGVARAQVAVAESNLAATRSTVAADVSDLAQKRRDSERATALANTAAGSIQASEQAETALRQSQATLARDQALVQVAVTNVALARANETATATKLSLDEVILGDTILRAPFDGVLAVRQAEVGEYAGPGVAIFTLDDLDHVWLRAYVNEPDLGKVRLNQPVQVTTDTYPGKIYHGRISFISPEAEFTPKTVETHAERVTQVYEVRIDLDNPTHQLLPGMPADARITASPPGS